MYEAITRSNATKIAVANGHVYTIGSFDTDWPVNLTAIWEDNVLMHYYGPYEPTIHDVCTIEDSYYCAIANRWGDGISKNGQDEMLWIGYAFTMLSAMNSVYVIGEDFDYKYYIWENFEKQFQIKNCNTINDACVSEWSHSIDEPINDAMFAVYPNPANSVVFVRLPQCDSPTTNQTYCITNLMGQTVLQGNITANSQQINIEKLPAGTYFISMSNQTLKFVVR